MIIYILILGFFVRLISLNQSIWLDEGTTALVAGMDLKIIFTQFLPADFHPPAYYLLMKGWTELFGNSEIGLRLPSVIFGTGTIYLTYLIGKKMFNKETGVFAALLISLNGLSIYYSQEARMYAMAAFLVALTFHLFLNKKWAYFSFALALIGLTDYVALFVLIPLFLIGYKYKKFYLALTPLVLSFLIWLPTFTNQIQGGLSVKNGSPLWWKILGTLTIKNIALIPIKFVIGRISFSNPVTYIFAVLVAVGSYTFLLLKSIKHAKELWVWLIVPILIGMVVSIKIPTLSYFRFLFCLPPLFILVSAGALKLKRPFAIIFIIVLVLINSITSSIYLFNSKYHRENWRSLVNQIEAGMTNNSITVFPSYSNTEAYLYYAPNAKITGPKGPFSDYSDIWFVDYLTEVFDPENSLRQKFKIDGYMKAEEFRVRGIVVERYQLKISKP